MKNVIDNQGTTPDEARKMLQNLCENGFDGNAKKIAVALGRPENEIKNILNGEEDVDTDLVLKIRGLADEREIKIQ